MKNLFFSLLGFLCLFNLLNAEGFQAYNDSNIPLYVVVFDATGAKIGKFSVAPRGNKTWHIPLTEFRRYNQTTTPYRVQFYCEQGSLFSEWASVSPGEAVTALGGSGPRSCPKKKKGQKDDDEKEPFIKPGKSWSEEGDSDTRKLDEF
jgi:hypothetical protein